MQSDYRDRISIAVWAVTFTLGVSQLLSLPQQGTRVPLGQYMWPLPIDIGSLIPVLLALLAGSGTEAVVRAHPLAQEGALPWTIRFWALPIAVTLLATFLLPQAPSTLYLAAGLLLLAIALSGVLVALYFSLDTTATGYRRARAALNLVCYAIAFLLFLLIPPHWPRLGRSLSLSGGALLLSLELLRGTRAPAPAVALHALILAVVVAETAWVLPWVGLNKVAEGLLLLLLFYLLVGLAWQNLTQRLSRRVAVEFAAVGLAGLMIILLTAAFALPAPCARQPAAAPAGLDSATRTHRRAPRPSASCTAPDWLAPTGPPVEQP